MGELRWDLSDLFQNNEDFYREIEKIQQKLMMIKKYEMQVLDENSLYDLLEEKWKIKQLLNNVLVYGSLKYYQNVRSDECIKLKSTAEKFNNEANLELDFVDRKILKLGKEKIQQFMKNHRLELYQFHFATLFRMQEHIQNKEINIKIKDNIDEIQSQLNLYNNTIREMKYGKIRVKGKLIELTSANFVSHLASRNREIRRQAYFIVNQKCKDLQDTFANILDSIFEHRIKNAQLEQYQSVLEKILFEENIDLEIIDGLIEAVHNHFDCIQKYIRIKLDVLEIEKPHLYDIGVPLMDQLEIHYSIEEALVIIKNALKPLGNEYLEVVDLLLNGHVDAEVDDNKHQSITFSWNTYSFMNFRGTYESLKDLVHELGHIVNYYLSSKNCPFIYADSTIFVGETASLVNEILLNRYLYEKAKDKEEKIFYLNKEIENYFTSVFKQTMYTEFERDLYHTKLSQNLIPEIISEKYFHLLQNYYGNDFIYDDISKFEWPRLGHIYRWSYYPYKYATGLLISSNVVSNLIDKKTITKEQYLSFLSAGNRMYSSDLLRKIGIDITKKEVFQTSFQVLENDIEELSKLLSQES